MPYDLPPPHLLSDPLPPTLRERFRSLLQHHLGKLAASFCAASGAAMVIYHSPPAAVILFAFSALFAIFWLLREVHLLSRVSVLLTLCLYVPIALPTGRYVSWWLDTPPVGRAITLKHINSEDWDPKYIGSVTTLRRTPTLNWMFPPTLHPTFVQDRPYGFIFEVSHDEIGHGAWGTLTIIAPEGTEIRNNPLERMWIRRGNSLRTEYSNLRAEPPEMITGLAIRPERRGRYTMHYILSGVATDPNEQRDNFIVERKFVINFH